MQSDGRASPSPVQKTVAEVEAALDCARLDEAQRALRELRELGDPASPQALLLAARLRLLYDDAPEAIRLLANQHFEHAAQQVQAFILLGSAHARVGAYDAADEYFALAGDVAARTHDTDALAELAFQRGRRYAFAGELDKAREQQRLLLRAPAHAREIDALHLESFIDGLEGRFTDQAATLVQMLDRIDPADERFAWQAASGTFSLAALARELDLPDAIPAVERQLRARAWPAHLNLQRFQALKALGWSYALRGDYFTAFRHLKKSAAYAPSPAWEAVAALDRAYLARCLHEERWSRQELSEAEELAETVDWHAARNEERVALLLLADMFAAVDAGRAARYMATFRELGEIHVPLLLYERDDRLQAQAQYCASVTQLALGNTKTAVKLMRDSYAIYDRIGYGWRAGRCALRLFEATGDAEYLRIAGEKLHRYPNSWLADEVRAHAKTKSVLPALPPMQHRVFEELRRGLSTAEIARNLGRSEYTIKNHIKLIFKAFGVKSRAALIAKVSRPRE
ncbi:MAG TPA: helix-turn-helix transcriptional regulator [Candidatus Baltobacteraceae bacterium]|nr:helix-turn-helix transcriptional regulator [Candidatus Baltobacteraceae bacterium]